MTSGTFIEDYKPATFVERGVAVPFTTPLLTSARVRPTHKGRPEFIIANPSGGQGYYVMGWEGLLGLTKITVHDRLLYDGVCKEPILTPSSIRSAARAVAQSSAAGRPAAKAAKAQLQREADERLIANLLLIMHLLRQAGLKNIDWRHFDPADRGLRAKTRAFIEKLEPTLGGKAEDVFAWIEDLSAIVAPVGFPSQDYVSAQQATIASLRKLHGSLFSFANADLTEAAQSARFAAEVAKFTLDLADRTFRDCFAELNDLVRLLKSWSGNRERLLMLFGRPDWLLDGWREICGLWEGACESGRDAQREAILEIERLIPVMPKEVADWVGGGVAVERPGSQRRWVRGNTDWRTGARVLDLTARNEMMRAYAA